jgi:hypothetical protein
VCECVVSSVLRDTECVDARSRRRVAARRFDLVAHYFDVHVVLKSVTHIHRAELSSADERDSAFYFASDVLNIPRVRFFFVVDRAAKRLRAFQCFFLADKLNNCADAETRVVQFDDVVAEFVDLQQRHVYCLRSPCLRCCFAQVQFRVARRDCFRHGDCLRQCVN